MKSEFLFIFFLGFQLAVGDVEVRIDDLAEQVKELREEVSDLSKTLEFLEKSVVKRNIADQKLDKAIANVLLNNQEKATAYWKEVVNYLDPSLVNEYLKTLVESTYLGNSDNFYYILEFLTRNELYVGFLMLYKELVEHRELHSGQEIFALANTVKSHCGSSSRFYNELPKVIQEILAGPVLLKNVDSKGYILADENNYPCENQSICYQNKKSQVFIDLFPSNMSVEDIKTSSRTYWQFVGPKNITELSSGFYLKNMDKDLFLVFNQRPPQSFLKGNATIKPYYSQETHIQFFPTLVPNTNQDESLLRFAVRDKISRKINFFYSGIFAKRNKRLNLYKKTIFEGELKGFVWEVVPVSSDNIDNAIEGRGLNEQCDL